MKTYLKKFKDSFRFRNRKDESGTLLNNKRLGRESAIHALANSRISYTENAERRFEGRLKLSKIFKIFFLRFRDQKPDCVSSLKGRQEDAKEETEMTSA